MKTSEFDYDLPRDLIAQYPPKVRGTTRLLVLDPVSGEIMHRKYADSACFIRKGDVVVLNRTKVFRARVHAKVERTGREVEVLFLDPVGEKDSSVWYCLVGRARHINIGDILTVGDQKMEVLERRAGEKGFRISVADAYSVMRTYGNVPLPPYIDRDPVPDDDERYNTVFSDTPGSVAAPTASLNVTPELIREIKRKGGKIAYVDLHVGLGTFSPVSSEEIEEHVMHREYFEISCDAAETINSCKRKVWALGTTVVRALESSADDEGQVKPFVGNTELFIYPGYTFKVIDVLVTNFHMPRTSLIMLVSAFAGTENTHAAYAEAIREKYHFLSYGDSMLIGHFPEGQTA